MRGPPREAYVSNMPRIAGIALLVLGVAAGVAVSLISVTAPCDPHAPIMSLDSTRAMPQPWASWSAGLNFLASVLIGTGAALIVERRRVLAGLAFWLTGGFVVYLVAIHFWSQHCPT